MSSREMNRSVVYSSMLMSLRANRHSSRDFWKARGKAKAHVGEVNVATPDLLASCPSRRSLVR